MSSLGDQSPMLTVQERRALALSVTGLVVTEVAQAMGTSAGLVRVLLASAITKLGARSKLASAVDPA
jgi:DNA-binding CsgD family transcriptional regulator